MAPNQTTEQIIADVMARPGGAKPEAAVEATEAEIAEAGKGEAGDKAEKIEAGKDDEKKTVPLHFVIEERTRRRGAEKALDEERKELAATRQRVAKMEELFQQAQHERAEPKPKDGAVPPAFEADPLGHLKHTVDQFGQRIEKLYGDEDQRRRGEAQTAQERQITFGLAVAAEEFSKTQPDFRAAYEHLWKDRNEELIEAGFDDPAWRHQILTADEKGIVATALQQNKNPAERLYALAKRRGYKPVSEASGGKGEADIETLKKGADAAKSLGGAKGAVETTLSLGAIADLYNSGDIAAGDREWAKAKRAGLLG